MCILFLIVHILYMVYCFKFTIFNWLLLLRLHKCDIWIASLLNILLYFFCFKFFFPSALSYCSVSNIVSHSKGYTQWQYFPIDCDFLIHFIVTSGAEWCSNKIKYRCDFWTEHMQNICPILTLNLWSQNLWKISCWCQKTLWLLFVDRIHFFPSPRILSFDIFLFYQLYFSISKATIFSSLTMESVITWKKKRKKKKYEIAQVLLGFSPSTTSDKRKKKKIHVAQTIGILNACC